MTVFLVDLESVETRYTGQWKTHLPDLLSSQGLQVQVISGPNNIPSATTPGAFLNFGGTNIYKAAQVEQIGRLFCNGNVKSGDHFLFTDAWHPGIINLKYMSELLNIPVKIHALWHAGSYDPQDFLGRLIGDALWVRHAEKSFYHAVDHNYFATKFHIKLFCENLLGFTPADTLYDKKIVQTGWPMEYMETTLAPYRGRKKSNLIVFPHRLAPEKQVEIFRDLKKELPQYDFVVCQDIQLDKHQYHSILAEAKIVFSANLQETLGISCYEGALLDAIPFVPDRLSYTEMYNFRYKYPSEWTENYEHYQKNKFLLIDSICHIINNYGMYKSPLKEQTNILTKKFFSCDNLIENIKNG